MVKNSQLHAGPQRVKGFSMTVGNLQAVTVNVLHEIDTKFNTFGM